MNIVIVGDGKVGYTLASELSREGHDIVIIDKNERVLGGAQDTLDVMTVTGNGASLEIQKEAGVKDSDLLIAATSSDEVNILSCVLARRLGCANTIARVRNPEYESQLSFLRDDLGLSMTVNPEKSAAHEIFSLLQFPTFLNRDTFSRGRIELVELMIRPDSILSGVELNKFYDIVKVKVLICVVDRNGAITIPSGDFVLMAGDKITVTAASSNLAMFIKNLNISNVKVHNVVIIGGSRTAVYLAAELVKSRVSVKIIEKDPQRCLELSGLLPDVLILEGDGSSVALIESEDIANADAVVTLTGIDEENLIISMYAKSLGVPKCIPKINNVEYGNILKNTGVESFVVPKRLTTEKIVRYVRAMESTSGGQVVSLIRIANGTAEALEFTVSDDFGGNSIPFSSLDIKDSILIACILRGASIIIPGGSDYLQSGDDVIIVAPTNNAIIDLNDILV